MTNLQPSIMNPARRAFLSQAVSVAAGGAAATLAASVSGSAIAMASGPDPILEAIEAHKLAHAVFGDRIDAHTELEKKLPRDRRRSVVDCYEERIVETDDPRWIACEREVIRSMDAETDAAITLVSICPTTHAGVLALLQYALVRDNDGEAWPRELVSDDGTKERSWHYFLIGNVAAALADIGSGQWA